jgi:hypothetical protein
VCDPDRVLTIETVKIQELDDEQEMARKLEGRRITLHQEKNQKDGA